MTAIELERVHFDLEGAQQLTAMANPAVQNDLTNVARSANLAALNPPLTRWTIVGATGEELVLAGWRDGDNPIQPERDPDLEPWSRNLVTGRTLQPTVPEAGNRITLRGRVLAEKRSTNGNRGSIDPGFVPGASRNKCARLREQWLREKLTASLADFGWPGTDFNMDWCSGYLGKSLRSVKSKRARSKTYRPTRHMILDATISLTVQEPDRLAEWLLQGCGRQKGYGFGIFVPVEAFDV